MTHTYSLHDGGNNKGKDTVRPSIIKQWNKMHSSQTMYSWLHGATCTACTVCCVLRTMDYNHGNPGYIWTPVDSYFAIVDKMWNDYKRWLILKSDYAFQSIYFNKAFVDFEM